MAWLRNILFILLCLLAFTACNPFDYDRSAQVSDEQLEAALHKYSPSLHFSGSDKDSLLADMVTYIFRRPAKATSDSRTNPEFRAYYVRSANRFEWVYHHLAGDGYHYFYVIRPARTLEANYRGVGGRFIRNEQNGFIEFEEIFNTTIMERDLLRRKGLFLFEELINTGAVNQFANDRTIIEWPDHRLYYDKQHREWKYRK